MIDEVVMALWMSIHYEDVFVMMLFVVVLFVLFFYSLGALGRSRTRETGELSRGRLLSSSLVSAPRSGFGWVGGSTETHTAS